MTAPGPRRDDPVRAPAPVVATAGGSVFGRADPGDGGERFFGIPYAAPPIGARRFAPAERHPGWSGLRDATAFGPASAQQFDPLETCFADYGEPGPARAWVGDEDSLTLNIWRPARAAGPLPVLVWIHGGANWLEASRLPIYDGAVFAAAGVVFVSFNYRLGVFGWLDLSPIGGPSGAHSNGLTDQLAALDWIAGNIAGFGGDPGNVTLVGESAGAMDIGWLVASRRLPRGVRRLVLMSGVASVVGLGWDGERSAHAPAEGARRAAAFLDALGYARFDQLRDAPTAEILTRQAAVARAGSILFDMDTLFYPRTGALAPTDPFVAARDGAAAGLDVMIGFTAYELGLWLLWDDALDRRGVDWAATAMPHLPAAARAALPALYRRWLPGEPDGALGLHLLGDAMFAMPSLWLADLLAAAGSRVFAYRFDWAADARRRALHALDQAFLFGQQNAPAGEALAGPPAHPADAIARDALGDELRAAVLAFARAGTPGTAWPAYDAARRATLLLDTPSRTADDPLGERRCWWTANVLPRGLGGGA